MPVISTTYSIEVRTSVGQPTTLPLEIPDMLEENVTWLKDGQQTTHRVLKDGSLYISHTESSDQGEYTVMVIKDYDTNSKAYTVLVVAPEMPLGLLCVLQLVNLHCIFQMSVLVIQSLRLKIFQNMCPC